MQFMDQIFSFQIGDINFFFSSNIRVSKMSIYSKFNQPISYQIQTLSHQTQSNPFKFHYSDYQISNAQLGGTFQMGG